MSATSSGGDALYAASQSGVKIDLLVRGICCLRPRVPGLSENIRVVSIIGRFLEHSRIFYFANGGEAEHYLGSADWMPRNFDRRVEAIAPVEKASLHERLRALLDLYLADNRQAWELEGDGNWTQRMPSDVTSASHESLMVNSWGILDGTVGSGLWAARDSSPYPAYPAAESLEPKAPLTPHRRKAPRRKR